jgi:exodeoxyribonuclease VII large subunit
VVEESIPHVVFTGEIFQFTRARSGHLYFTVCDKDAQIAAVMWQGMARGLEFEPQTGDQVVCYGRPTFYGRAGKLQVVVHRMVPSGDGQLQKKFERLKEKLDREGLFDDTRKRTLPFLPKAVGIITSKSGAAIHDVMTRIRDRMPSQRVYLFDAKVQGDGAAEQIVNGIEFFQQSEDVDVVIVCRGGGSLEDLWAFNEEIVVRAIFASRVPVISAVGHEVDVTLSDLVADHRAPTPTAAGEVVVPRRDDLLSQLDALEERLFDLDYWFAPLQQRFDETSAALEAGILRRLQEGRLILDRLEAQVQTLRPDRLLAELRSRLESASVRLASGLEQGVVSRRALLDRREGALQRALPVERLYRYSERLDQIAFRLARSVDGQIEKRSERISVLQERLRAASPERVLERGYALVTLRGEAVKGTDQVSPGEQVSVRLHDGQFEANVLQVQEKQNSGG